MSQIVMALVMLALTAYCASRLYDGFRDGRMPLFFGHAWSLVFDRTTAPLFFWGAAGFNALLTAIVAAGGIVLVTGAVIAR